MISGAFAVRHEKTVNLPLIDNCCPYSCRCQIVHVSSSSLLLNSNTSRAADKHLGDRSQDELAGPCTELYLCSVTPLLCCCRHTSPPATHNPNR